MSSKVIEVELPTGETIWARVPVDDLANVDSSTLKRLDLEDIRRTVHGVSESLRAALDDLTPSEVQIAFGLELAIKTGKVTSLLAEVGAKATVTISLTWRGDGPAAIGMTAGPAAVAPPVAE